MCQLESRSLSDRKSRLRRCYQSSMQGDSNFDYSESEDQRRGFLVVDYGWHPPGEGDLRVGSPQPSGASVLISQNKKRILIFWWLSGWDVTNELLEWWFKTPRNNWFENWNWSTKQNRLKDRNIELSRVWISGSRNPALSMPSRGYMSQLILLTAFTTYFEFYFWHLYPRVLTRGQEMKSLSTLELAI